MFITLEGIEGSGKTTQMGEIAHFLEENGHDVVMTREPGATPIGQKIRSILLDPENQSISPLCELLLYGADRSQHIFEVILPALNSGKTVLCDRFADATMAYQGAARGLDVSMIEAIYQIVAGQYPKEMRTGQGTLPNVAEGDMLEQTVLKPDLTILFDCDPAKGLQRADAALQGGERSKDESRFEQEALDFHERVRQGYLDIARNEMNRFLVVDASGDRRSVFDEIVLKLSKINGVMKGEHP